MPTMAMMSPAMRQIVGLSRDGLHPIAIAHHTGRSPTVVRVLLSKARKRGIDVDGPDGPLVRVNVHISEAQRDQIDAVAVERGVTRSELASRIMAAVVASDLFAAILDR